MPSIADPNKNTTITVDIGKEYKKEILRLIEKKEYETISHFIRDLLKKEFQFY